MRHVLVLALVVGVAGWAATLASAKTASSCSTTKPVTVTQGLAVAAGSATVGFTVAHGCSVQVSLVSYMAPGSTFDEQTASQQVLYKSVTETLSEGSYTLTVAVPSCYHQIDFVYGTPIHQLGPAGSQNFYGKQGRLIATATGGSTACVAPPTCPSQGMVQLDSGGISVANGTATVHFTIAAGCSDLVLSLVSYTAPGPTFSEQTASQQVLYQSTTQTLGAGAHTMTVAVPSCYYQVDFVHGSPIAQLGPAGTTNFYGAEGRLIESVNGGTSSCRTPTHSGGTPTGTHTGGGQQTQTPPPPPPPHQQQQTPTQTQTPPVVTTHPAVPAPTITLVKLERVGHTGSFVGGPVSAKVGDTIDYELVVTDTGSTDVSVNLTDTGCTSLMPMGPQGLRAGASLTFTCSHVITAADGSSYTNTATATANNAGPVKATVKATVTATIGTTSGVKGASKTIRTHKKVAHKVKKVTKKAKAAHAVRARARVTG
jgi:hypothetical protein